MTVNSNYAKQLGKRFDRLPSEALRAVGRAVYTSVLNNTLQDSGEAAFNWRANINTVRIRPYIEQRGRPPVGSTGEKRSLGFDRFIVINYRLADFISRLGNKIIKTIFIYNPIEDSEHEARAKIQVAGAMSIGQDFLSDVAERAVRVAERSGISANL